MMRKGGPGREDDKVLVVATLQHEWEPFITWVVTRLQKNDSLFLLHVIDCARGGDSPCSGLCKENSADSPEMRCVRKRKKWLANTLAALGDYYSSTVVLTCTKVVHNLNLASAVKKQAHTLRATRVIVSGAGCFTADPYDRHLTEEFLRSVQRGLTTDCLLLLVDNWRIADARRGTKGLLDGDKPAILDAKWSKRRQLPAVNLTECPSIDSASGQAMSDTEEPADVSSPPATSAGQPTGSDGRSKGITPSLSVSAMVTLGQTEEELLQAQDAYIRTVEDDPFRIDLNSFKREIDSIFEPNKNDSNASERRQPSVFDDTRYAPEEDTFGSGVQLESFQNSRNLDRSKARALSMNSAYTRTGIREKHYDRSQSMSATSALPAGSRATEGVSCTPSTARAAPAVSSMWVRTMASLINMSPA